jgi:hypothetical protein
VSKNYLEEQIKNIKLQIEALKRQKKKLERLIAIFTKHKEILDGWSDKVVEILEIRKGLGLKPFELPNNEKRKLNKTLTVEVTKQYEEFLNITLYESLDEVRELSIEKIKIELSKMDHIIFELELLYKSRIIKREKSALRMAKSIILKRAIPIMGGIALIALNLNSAIWTSVIIGSLSIARGLEPA